MKKCNVCRVREAQVPDREQPGRPIKRICRQCHADRLIGDLKRILAYEQEKYEQEKDEHICTTRTSGMPGRVCWACIKEDRECPDENV